MLQCYLLLFYSVWRLSTIFCLYIFCFKDVHVKEYKVNDSVYEFHVKELSPGMDYSIVVHAVYVTGTRVPAKPLHIKTLNDPTDISMSICEASVLGDIYLV